MSDSSLQSSLESIVEPVCRAHGVELVDVRHVRRKGGAVVRIIIDRERPTGQDLPGSDITIDDCTEVSRDVSAALDVHEDLIPGSYDLEVSSPGLERPLVKPRDFERFAGREVKVQTHVRLHERRKFQGRLLGLVDSQVELEQEGQTIRIPFEAVSKAHIVYRF